jgi:2,3-dihydroxybenzoate decarboxylase
MDGKIALEEHFAIPDTLGDSQIHAVGGGWSALEHCLLDVGDRRIAEMDKHGIALAIVSLNSPGIQAIHNRAKAIDVARRANDTLAAAVARRPDRLAGFAALPMQDPEAATAELTRTVLQLGFKGALVNGFSQIDDPETVAYCDDPRYLPFWAEVERLGVPFYLHPRDPLPSREPIYDGHPWFVGSAWAFGAETALHALRLMGSGLFDRHPRLKIILGHLGEGISFSVWRCDHRLSKLPRGIPAKRTMTEYFRTNFWLTTSGHFRTSSLLNAMAEIGSDRILFSVDYPFEDTVDATTWLDEADISESDRLKIGRTNAAALFTLAEALPAHGRRTP